MKRSGPPKRTAGLARGKPLQPGKGLQSGQPLARRTRVKPMSDRRAQEMVVRRQLMDALLAVRPWCEAKLPGCMRQACDGHELKSRGRGGSFINEANVLMVCRACHHVITTEPAMAERLGLALHSWDKEPGT